MYDIERQNKILELLSDKKSISVNKLAEILYTSGSTIRRDLTKMEQKGLVTRTFGAVVLNSNQSNKETSFELREKTNINEKREICLRAADYLKDNSVIFIDSSTTVLHIVPHLNLFKNLTIITNGIHIATEISNSTKHSVIILGGRVSSSTNSILGPTTIHNISKFHADFSLLSCGAVNLKHGFFESTIESAELKNKMVSLSDKVILLVDSSKFNLSSLAKTCDLKDIDILITTKEFTDEEQRYIKEQGVLLSE